MSNVRHDVLIGLLPYARRYARALSGNQSRGDALVADALRSILSNANGPDDLRLELYHWVTQLFNRSDGRPSGDGLPSRQRQLLLLTSLEEMPVEDAAPILGMPLSEAKAELTEARERLRTSTARDVLIIEDEPIIAMDIEELVQSCGHRVVGVATTEREAVEIARRTRPGLILADINLGAGGDGASAVSRILESHRAPVIFVTAYPERLLTGEVMEPAFVITKPFEPITLAVATYQAATGGMPLQ